MCLMLQILLPKKTHLIWMKWIRRTFYITYTYMYAFAIALFIWVHFRLIKSHKLYISVWVEHVQSCYLLKYIKKLLHGYLIYGERDMKGYEGHWIWMEIYEGRPKFNYTIKYKQRILIYIWFTDYFGKKNIFNLIEKASNRLNLAPINCMIKIFNILMNIFIYKYTNFSSSFINNEK